jgi:rsbT antagonist protein RsbS
MSVPILKQGDCLIASVQGALGDAELLELRNNLAERVGEVRARWVIVDVTAIDVLDSFACRTLHAVAEISRLRGAEAVIAGIQPDVAFAMVQLGLRLSGVTTALDLEDALEHVTLKRSSVSASAR